METSTHAMHEVAARMPGELLDGQAAARRRQVVGVTVGPGGAAVLTTTLRPPASRAAATDLAARRPFNLVAKPLTATRIVRAVPEGAMLTRVGSSANGFAKVVYDGCRGYAPWVSLVRPGQGSWCDPELMGRATTTAEVRLRALPNMDAAVLGAIPAGATVRHDRQLVNGFLEVEHRGRWGWVWIDYLA